MWKRCFRALGFLRSGPLERPHQIPVLDRGVNTVSGDYAQARNNYNESLRLGIPIVGERSRFVLNSRLGLTKTLAKLGDGVATREQMKLLDKAVQGMPESAPLRRQYKALLAELDKPSN